MRPMAESFQPLGIRVLTVSDTRDESTDKSGGLLWQQLGEAGHELLDRALLPDDLLLLRAQFAAWIAHPKTDVIVATGGTGITARDVTPEALSPLITKHIPGFGELFRMLSYAEIGASTIQSRADAALCGGVLVFVLPGSTGAVRLALEKILLPQLDARTKPCNFAELLPRIRGSVR